MWLGYFYFIPSGNKNLSTCSKILTASSKKLSAKSKCKNGYIESIFFSYKEKVEKLQKKACLLCNINFIWFKLTSTKIVNVEIQS